MLQVYLYYLLLTLLVSEYYTVVVVSASSSISSSSQTSTIKNNNKQGKPPTVEELCEKGLIDRWVMASPLSCAAVCKDGIAIVATHESAASSYSDEPLLLPITTTTTTATDSSDSTINKEEDKAKGDEKMMRFKSLPKTYKGPLRIEQILDTTTSSYYILSAGWRTDCMTMKEYCRTKLHQERKKFGILSLGKEQTTETSTTTKPQSMMINDNESEILGESASFYMAQCEFSESVRSLSCVSLILSHHYSRKLTSTTTPKILFIDATGCYNARAFAIGNNSGKVNSKLCHVDFTKLSKEEGVMKLLEIISGVDDGEEHDVNERERYMEAAVIGNDGFKRLLKDFDIIPI